MDSFFPPQALGMPGSTAYGGLIDVLRPLKCPEGEEKDAKAPEVIWVSGAAGAVGGMVGMIAKQIYGCTVIGSCGGPEKCALIKVDYFLIINKMPRNLCWHF